MEETRIYEIGFVMVSAFSWTHSFIRFLLLLLNIYVASEGL